MLQLRTNTVLQSVRISDIPESFFHHQNSVWFLILSFLLQILQQLRLVVINESFAAQFFQDKRRIDCICQSRMILTIRCDFKLCESGAQSSLLVFLCLVLTS